MEAELDLALGNLHVAIGNLSEEVADLKLRLANLQDDLVVTGTTNCPNPSATFYLDLGHPTAGRWWQVRNIVVGGSDITAAPGGIGWVVVMSREPTAQTPMFAVRDFTSGTLPQKSFYGAHELICQQNEHLYVVITGGTAGAQYSATAAVESFPQFTKSSV